MTEPDPKDDMRPVAAYRTWRCFPDPDQLELYSYISSYKWDLDGVNRATCRLPVDLKGHPDDEVAALGCSCGFYGYKSWQDKSLDFARSYPWFYMPDRGYMLVSGLMAGGGRVSEHDLGFRVETATVMAILKPREVSSLAKSRMAGDSFALEVILWEEWVFTTLPLLARNHGIPMVEGEELLDVLSQHNLTSY